MNNTERSKAAEGLVYVLSYILSSQYDAELRDKLNLKKVGLCSTVRNIVMEGDIIESEPGRIQALALWWGQLDKMFKKWPEYSGSVAHPVPAHDYTVDGVNFTRGAQAREAYNFCGTLFSVDHEYGRARYRLAEHLVTSLEVFIRA